MLFELNAGNYTSPSGIQIQIGHCIGCQSILYDLSYHKLEFFFDFRFDWKPIFRGGAHTYFREDVVEKMIEEKLTGAEFIEVRMRFKVPPADGKQFRYYVLRPLSSIDTILRDEDFEVPCEVCKQVQKRTFNSLGRPLQMVWDTWDGSDIVHPTRWCYNFVLLSRRAVDVLRKNGWHHDIVKGRWGKKCEAITIGGHEFPGVRAKNIDSDTWYEDTLAVLKEKFPDMQHESPEPKTSERFSFITPDPPDTAPPRKQTMPKFLPIKKIPIGHELYDGLYVDRNSNEIFVNIACPPYSTMRVNIQTTAINTKVEFTKPNAAGKSKMSAYAEFDPTVALTSLAACEPVWPRWEKLWAALFLELLNVRERYERDEPFAGDHLRITLEPPGDYIDYKSKQWTCRIGIEPLDEGYEIEFNLKGTILNSGAA